MKDIIKIDDAEYKTEYTESYLSKKKYKLPEKGLLTAFLPGLILNVMIKDGAVIKANTPMMILEAMKMYNELTLPYDIIVKKIVVNKGEIVVKNQLLLEYDEVIIKKVKKVKKEV